MTDRRVVVVDGSNLATEGRTIPSLHQLDDAVRAYALEDPDAEIVVVVDASFEHRVGPEERAQLEEAELHGEVVSPPAGAIGRGDAFVLRIAERTGASVLSNDSFQEFHGEHPWLFDTGRLIGGKPVPGIGWIFTPRIPVRGPKSRQATSKAARASTGEPLSPPVKAAELAKAARKAAAKRMAVLPDGSTPKVGDVWGEPAGGPEGSAVAAGPEGPEAEAPGAPRPAKGAKAKSGRAEKAKGGTASTTTAGGRAAKKVRPAAEVVVPDEIEIEDATGEVAAKAVRSGQPARSRGKKAAVPRKAAGAAGGGPAEGVDTPSGGGPGRRRSRRDPAVREAIDDATAEALSPPVPADVTGKGEGGRRSHGAKGAKGRGKAAKGGAKGGAEGAHGGGEGAEADGKGAQADGKGAEADGTGAKHRRRRSTTPPPAVNEPLAFITFVASYPVGAEVAGEVVSFTSHGAMVDVELPEGGSLHCYIPLGAMADPPPTKARQVLTRGERRPFVLAGLDPPRRVAELALPGVATATPSDGDGA